MGGGGGDQALEGKNLLDTNTRPVPARPGLLCVPLVISVTYGDIFWLLGGSLYQCGRVAIISGDDASSVVVPTLPPPAQN